MLQRWQLSLTRPRGNRQCGRDGIQYAKRSAAIGRVASPRSSRRYVDVGRGVVETMSTGVTDLDWLETILRKHPDNCNFILNNE
jgi:hypothetical protein